jgi:hypothetical protein
VVVLSVGTGGPRARAEQEIAHREQAVILARALAYDGALKTRAGSTVVIAVLSRAGHAASEATGAAMLAAFAAMRPVRLQGLPMDVVALSYSGAEPLRAAIAAQGIDAVYVCPGFDAELAAISGVTRTAKVISLASEPGYVSRGLAMGVFPIEGKKTITINLAASRAEGASLNSQLLRLAKIVE